MSMRFKEKHTTRGITQKEGMDFNNVLSLVMKHRSTIILLAMLSRFDLALEQMDVKTDILYGDLDEMIYWSSLKGMTKSEIL